MRLTVVVERRDEGLLAAARRQPYQLDHLRPRALELVRALRALLARTAYDDQPVARRIVRQILVERGMTRKLFGLGLCLVRADAPDIAAIFRPRHEGERLAVG